MRLVRQLSAHVRGPTTPPLSTLPISQTLRRTVDKYPHDEAAIFVHSQTRATFEQIEYDTNHLAAGLLAAGLRRGDRLGIWSYNHYEWLTTQFAAAKAGLILVNINPSYRPNELAYALEKCNVKGLISDVKWGKQSFADVLFDSLKDNNFTKLDFVAFRGENIPSQPVKRANGDELRSFHFDHLSSGGGSDDFAAMESTIASQKSDEIVNIQFTSGTTGRPKGACLTHHNMINNQVSGGTRVNTVHGDRYLVNVPLYHCFGCVGASMALAVNGVTLCFPHPTFDVSKSIDAIRSEQLNVWMGTPTMYVDLLNASDNDVGHVVNGRAVMGGALCPPELSRQCRETFQIDLLNAYGCTENSPATFYTDQMDSFEQKTTTVGSVMPHTEAKLVTMDDNGIEYIVERNQVGEVKIRGYCVFAGYWDEPEKTADVIDENGWYATGDLGMLDDEGYLQIVGRSKDLIIRGGENIYPKEVEDVFIEHPNVLDCHVVAVSSARMGEECAAYIRVKDDTDGALNDIRAHAKNMLTYFKVPKFIELVDHYPMTVTGKVQKFELRKDAEAKFGES